VEGVVVGGVVVGVVVGAVVGDVTAGLQTILMLVADCSVAERDSPVQVMDAVPPALKATADESSLTVADSLMSGAATPKPTTAAATGTKNLRVRDMSLRRSLWCEANAGQTVQSELTSTSHRGHVSVMRDAVRPSSKSSRTRSGSYGSALMPAIRVATIH
jgi:hypothetical protein